MSSLEEKTIRPGSLRYTYYHSSADEATHEPKKTRHHFRGLLITLLIVIAAFSAYSFMTNTSPKSLASSGNSTSSSNAVAPIKKTKTAPVVAATVNHCANNSLSQLILVSISARHLWACEGNKSVYDSPVVTGDTQYADTITPLGTYHIYAKETDRYLTGSDENGSWDDYVHYWMPFLDNQYGAYGLHDATWRTANEFGNINPDSATASNGCVELPLATAAWLYNWDEVGTTVTIES